MARFTSNKWALVKTDEGKVTNSASDSQTLFYEVGLRTAHGKLSLKQAMYKMEDWYNHESIALMSIGRDGNVYRFDRLEDIGRGQTNYNVVALRDTDPCFWVMKGHFKDGTMPKETKQKDVKPAKTKTMQTTEKTQTAEQLMVQAMQMLANGTDGAVNVEEVTKIVKSEIEKAKMPKVHTIEVKLPNKEKVKDLGVQHKKFESVLQAVADGSYVMLKGDAGSGKTYGAVQVAKALDLDYRIFSFTNEISLGRCIGYMDAMGKYVKTSIREMYEDGGLLILDEFDAMNPNVAVSLNNMLSGDEYTFPDKVVKKHKDFNVIACTNTFGRGADKDYSSRNKLDFATLDRFDEIFVWGYDENIERQVFGDTKATEVVFAIRKNARNLGITITPRRTKAVNRMVNRGVSLKDAVERAILVNYKKDQQRAMMEGVSL